MRQAHRSPAVLITVALMLTVLTFPAIDLAVTDGVDGSLGWAFNHLFHTGLAQAAYITFPHGPLAFLMYPSVMDGGLWPALVLILAIMLAFHGTMLALGTTDDVRRPLTTAIIACAMASLLEQHMLLVFTTAGALILYDRTRSRAWLALALAAALVALHVRANVGILAIALLVAHATWLIVRYRDVPTVGLGLLAFVVAAVLLRWGLYGSLDGLDTYYVGLVELARSSSAATGLYPSNDWWALGGALLLIVAIPLLVKDDHLRRMHLLFALALFAAWKHAITREDHYHARGGFDFVVAFHLLTVLAWPRPRIRVLLAMGAVAILGLRALTALPGYTGHALRPIGVATLHRWVCDPAGTVGDARERSRHHLAPYVLPDTVVEQLRRGTADVYPWEHSYLAANDLRWRPRPVPQSYASYTVWLDDANARYFAEGKGADRIIWHFQPDGWNGGMGSIDGRYLLNDEPRAILAMLDKYRWVPAGPRLAILERVPVSQLASPRTSDTLTVGWDTWIDVPPSDDAILRAHVDIRHTTWRDVVDFLYKDAVYEVVYRLADDRTLTYRIVPENARHGVWVAPFIRGPGLHCPELPVTAVRFQCSAPAMVHPTIGLVWEWVPMALPGTNALALFGQTARPPEDRLPPMEFGMEGPMPGWAWSGQDATDSLAHTGHRASLLGPQAFSATAEISLDTIAGPPTVRAQAWVRGNDGPGALVIISVEEQDGTVHWHAAGVEHFMHDRSGWNLAHVESTVPTGPGRLLKVYVWNNGARPILVDDMRVAFPRSASPL